VRKFCLFLAFLSLSFSIGGIAFAKLDPKFRKEFPEFVENLCASTVEYDLGELDSTKRAEEREGEFRKHKNEYDNTVNCLFNRAIVKRITSTNREVEEFFGRKITHPDFEFKEFEEEEKFCNKNLLRKTIQKQQRIREKNKNLATGKFEPVTMCMADEFEGGKDVYSSCRISEMMLSELCGYQNYLLAKREDDHTLLGDTKGRTLMEIEAESNEIKDYLDIEQIRSRKAMHNAILFYQQFEQNYRRHAWLIGIQEGLRDVGKRLSFFHDKIFNTFPTKFIDHEKLQ
jgi:hypothetical protein